MRGTCLWTSLHALVSPLWSVDIEVSVPANDVGYTSVFHWLEISFRAYYWLTLCPATKPRFRKLA